MPVSIDPEGLSFSKIIDIEILKSNVLINFSYIIVSDFFIRQKNQYY